MQCNPSKSSTVHNWKDLPSISGFLTMGNFDGVHIGHQNLIAEGKKNGEVSVLTYSPHPCVALGKATNPFLLTSDREKINFLEDLSVKNVIFLDFDSEISSMEPNEFIKKVIKERLNPDGMIVGYDHNFGKGRKGDAEFLARTGRNLGFEVIVHPEVKVNRQPVKSTMIREFIRSGQLKRAERVLNRPYSLTGIVISGSGLGKDLGYPTANIELDSEYKLLPPEGVYSSIAKIDDEEFPSMLYIGSSPTYGIKERKIEAHLLDFSGDLYGKNIQCTIYSFIRKQKYFSSKELLKENIDRNKEEIINSLKEAYKWN